MAVKTSVLAMLESVRVGQQGVVMKHRDTFADFCFMKVTLIYSWAEISRYFYKPLKCVKGKITIAQVLDLTLHLMFRSQCF
jgi:hypothetical protein